jgi:DNA-binding XRE family transcriptional regulator
MKLAAKEPRGNSFSQIKERLLKNPEVKQAYDDHTVVLETAAFIRELRIKAGYTQKVLAARMGVTQELVARLERGDGKRGMTVAMFARVVSACGQPVLVQPAPQDLVQVRQGQLILGLTQDFHGQ